MCLRIKLSIKYYDQGWKTQEWTWYNYLQWSVLLFKSSLLTGCQMVFFPLSFFFISWRHSYVMVGHFIKLLYLVSFYLAIFLVFYLIALKHISCEVHPKLSLFLSSFSRELIEYVCMFTKALSKQVPGKKAASASSWNNILYTDVYWLVNCLVLHFIPNIKQGIGKELMM